MKQTFRALGAGSVCAALVGVLALPAYAASNAGPEQSEIALAQALTTTAGFEISVPAQLPSAEEEPLPVVTQRAAASNTGAASAAASTYQAPAPVDIPAGAGASGIVAAALAQLGVGQDCTDLVQNSLAAVGLTTRRDQGGYDRGPRLDSWIGFGTQVSTASLAPGDILIYASSPIPHVAIYIGNGQAVHGGVAGGTAVMSIHAPYAALVTAVRPY